MRPAAWMLLVLALAAVGVVAAPASGLSCALPETDWGKLTVVDLVEGETVAEAPFEGATWGYGCGIGNVHDLREGWLAWVAEPEATDPVLYVVDLETQELTREPIGAEDARSVGVDPPHVLVLEREGNASWAAHRFTVDPGEAGVQEEERFAVTARWASLHGSLLHSLSSKEDPALTVRDLSQARVLVDEAPVPDVGDPPWRLLGGDASWAVLASDAQAERDRFLGEEARAWLWRVGTERVRELPAPTLEDGREGRLGVSVDFDGDELYTQAWGSSLPWSPSKLQVQRVPDGIPRAVEWNGSLIEGIAGDDGFAVTGSWLDEVPENASPWGELPERAQQVPSLGALTVAVVLVTALFPAQGASTGKRSSR